MAKISNNILEQGRWFHSIRWKLALCFLLVSIVPLAVYYNTVLSAIENYYVEDMRLSLLSRAEITVGRLAGSDYMQHRHDPAVMRELNQGLNAHSRDNQYRIMVLDDRFFVLHDTNLSQTGNVLIRPEIYGALSGQNNAVVDRENRVVFAAAALFDEDANRVGAVLLAESAEDVFDALESIQQDILLYTMVTILVVFFMVLLASWLLIEPLKNIVGVVQKMAEGHLDQRVTVKGHDEYSQLGRAFNHMSAKLEQTDKSREEFVSNVSHELKTPLSAIKVLSESILLQEDVPLETHREFLQDITSEVDRMTMIVNDLLALVKLDRREQGLDIAPMDLNRLVEDILRRLSPLAELRQIVLIYEDVRAVTLDADEMKISLAISNIVENGIKYTPTGGTVKVIVDADHQNAFITIQDTGIGIPQAEQALVFNRFYRVDKTRDRETGGTGLGLAISHSAVLLHNGSLRLTSVPDEGSTFVVRLPLRNVKAM